MPIYYTEGALIAVQSKQLGLNKPVVGGDGLAADQVFFDVGKDCLLYTSRPFRAPLYPLAPAFALGMAVLCLVAMVWYNLLLALIFAAMMLGGYLWFRKTAAARERAPVDPQLRTVS